MKKRIKIKAWAMSLYDGTGIFGEASEMSIFGSKSLAEAALYITKEEYGKDPHCKIRIFPVTIEYASFLSRQRRRKK